MTGPSPLILRDYSGTTEKRTHRHAHDERNRLMNGWTKNPDRLLMNPDYTPYLKVCHQLIAKSQGRDQRGRPKPFTEKATYKWLTKHMGGCSRGTISNCLRILEKDGWIIIHRGKGTAPNKIHAHLPDCPDDPLDCQMKMSSGTRDDHSVVRGVNTSGTRDDHYARLVVRGVDPVTESKKNQSPRERVLSPSNQEPTPNPMYGHGANCSCPTDSSGLCLPPED